MRLKIKHFATALHLRNKISKCSDSQIQPVLNFKVTHQPYTGRTSPKNAQRLSHPAWCAIFRLAVLISCQCTVHASTAFCSFLFNGISRYLEINFELSLLCYFFAWTFCQCFFLRFLQLWGRPVSGSFMDVFHKMPFVRCLTACQELVSSIDPK